MNYRILTFYFWGILYFFISNTVISQPKNGFSYQAIIRNTDNSLVSNSQVGIRISILQGSIGGPIIYSEVHTEPTNVNGLLNLIIGTGNTVDDFSSIDWSKGPYFLKTDIDPDGGSNYTITGTSQLLSVPYAKYADKAGSVVETDPVFSESLAAGITQQDTSRWGSVPDVSNQIPKKLSDFLNDIGFVETETDPVFENSPASSLNEEDKKRWNQAFKWGNHGAVGYLKKNEFDAHPASSISKQAIDNWNQAFKWGNHGAVGYLTANEYQALSISNDTLFLDNGGFVKLPATSYKNLVDIPENMDTNNTDDFDGDYYSLDRLPNLDYYRPIAAYTDGDMMYQVTKNFGYYNNARSVTITVPVGGKFLVEATGYVRWESKGWDLLLGAILSNKEGDPNNDWTAENKWYNHLMILTDYNCPDSSDQYTAWATKRGFHVSSGGTYTFTFWCNKYTSSSKTRIDDVHISAVFYPQEPPPPGAIPPDKKKIPSNQTSGIEQAKKKSVFYNYDKTKFYRAPDGMLIRK